MLAGVPGQAATMPALSPPSRFSTILQQLPNMTRSTIILPAICIRPNMEYLLWEPPFPKHTHSNLPKQQFANHLSSPCLTRSSLQEICQGGEVVSSSLGSLGSCLFPCSCFLLHLHPHLCVLSKTKGILPQHTLLTSSKCSHSLTVISSTICEFFSFCKASNALELYLHQQ